MLLLFFALRYEWGLGFLGASFNLFRTPGRSWCSCSLTYIFMKLYTVFEHKFYSFETKIFSLYLTHFLTFTSSLTIASDSL